MAFFARTQNAPILRTAGTQCRGPLHRGPLRHLRRASAIAALSISALQLLHAQPTESPKDLSSQEIIQRIDAAVETRNRNIKSYTVQELYTIYRGSDPKPAAQVTVNTTYRREAGKQYTPVNASGSALLRNVVIDHILTEEKEMASAASRPTISLTSDNYEMKPEPGIVEFNGRRCIIVSLKARRKIAFLLNGKGWFDASDFTLVHLEGAPAASPSIFAGQTAGHRDYTRVNGFSMAQHAEIRAHSFLFGNTLLKIDYSNYQIQLDHSNSGQDSTAESATSPYSSPAQNH